MVWSLNSVVYEKIQSRLISQSKGSNATLKKILCCKTDFYEGVILKGALSSAMPVCTVCGKLCHVM